MYTPPPPGRFALLFVFITVLLSMIGLGIIMPVMPELIGELTGLGAADASRYNGYLVTVYAVMQFIMAPILGALSDRYGRRPVLLISLLAYSLDFLLMAMAPTYAWLFIGRMLSGAFAATFATASAFIADVSPPEKRAANFGLIGAAFGLGFIIGPIIGGWAGDNDPRAPFYLASAVTFANFIFGFFVFPETVTDEKRRDFEWRRASPIGGLKSVSRHPLLVGVLSTYFLMQLAHHALPAVWAFFTTEKYGWTPSQIGQSLSYVGLTAAFVQGGLTRKVIPMIGETRAVYLGMLAMATSFLGYAFFTPSGSSLFVWITVGAIGGFMMPALQGIMSKAVPANEQGELQGAIASLMSMTMAISPLIMTQIFSTFTSRDDLPYFPGAPFLLAAALLLIALIPFTATMRRATPPSGDTPSENSAN